MLQETEQTLYEKAEKSGCGLYIINSKGKCTKYTTN